MNDDEQTGGASGPRHTGLVCPGCHSTLCNFCDRVQNYDIGHPLNVVLDRCCSDFNQVSILLHRNSFRFVRAPPVPLMR